MQPSSTSRRSLCILAVALLALVPADLLARQLDRPGSGDVVDALLEPPTSGGVWLLGNSIFKTGVDPLALSEQLDGEEVQFEYHGGHYTSLWYLIARNALPAVREKPGVVVWGFRPNYAALPAFRENAVNATETFLVEGDRVYEMLTDGIGKASTSPLDELAADIHDRAEQTGLFRLRNEAADHLSSTALDLGVWAADVVGTSAADLVRDTVIDGDASLLDVLNASVTGGSVQLAEERVVDGVGDFIEGDLTDYEDSFVPLVAEQIESLGLQQLVIIWPPVNVATGDPVAREDRFVDDAVRDLRDAGIPVLDLYHADGIGPELYASGDHFNPAGREEITTRVATALRELGFG